MNVELDRGVAITKKPHPGGRHGEVGGRWDKTFKGSQEDKAVGAHPIQQRLIEIQVRNLPYINLREGPP